MRTALLILAVLLVACTAVAAPRVETTFTASGGYRIVGANARGPILIEARAEGDTAGIWIADTQQLAPTVILRNSWPSVGFAYFKLYPGEPQRFYFSGGEADTFYVYDSAVVEVKVRCTFEN